MAIASPDTFWKLADALDEGLIPCGYILTDDIVAGLLGIPVDEISYASVVNAGKPTSIHLPNHRVLRPHGRIGHSCAELFARALDSEGHRVKKCKDGKWKVKVDRRKLGWCRRAWERTIANQKAAGLFNLSRIRLDPDTMLPIDLDDDEEDVIVMGVGHPVTDDEIIDDETRL